jgi:hypothetical protein
MAFNDTIQDLAGNSTFYDWFIKENDEIISKLNLITVSGVTSGDGVLVSLNASSGLATLSVGGTSGTIQTGLTFAGDIAFTGSVAVPNVSYRVSGITSGTSGYTFGSVVRITSDGYTLAQATNPDAAEVIGILSYLTSDYSIVTVSGKIDGDFTQVAGSTLSPGCVYFLSSATAGNITVNEPTTMGQVSKPVIIGLEDTSGVIVPYRGNYLNATLSGGGESAANRVYVTISNTPTDPSDHGFSAGNFVSFAPAMIAGNTFFNQVLVQSGRTAIDGWFLSGSRYYLNDIVVDETIYSRLDYSLEEDHIVGMIETVQENSPSGYNTYQIIIKGTTTVIPQSVLANPTVGSWCINGNTYEVAASGVTLQMVPHSIYSSESRADTYQLGFVFDNVPSYWYVNPKPMVEPFVVASFKASTSSSTFTSAYNYAFNGDFSIWQRNTGKSSQYTSSGTVYFADNWVRREDSIPAGSSQYIERKTFAVTDTDVEGNPQNYLRTKCVASSDPAGASYSVGYVIDDIETFNGSEITISFYAKCNNPSYSATVYFDRYSSGSRVDHEEIGSVNLSTTWTKYTISYDVSALSVGSYEDDYIEIGLDLMPLVEEAFTNGVAVGDALYVDLASFVVYEGTYTSPAHQFEKYDDKLRKAQRYYFSTYTEDQLIGSKTMLSTYDATLNTFSFTHLPNSPFSTFMLPARMRTSPTVSVYSPKTGIVNEMYNYTAFRDLRNTSGTIGYASQSRIAPIGTQTVSTSQDETTVKISINAGTVPYDVVNCHVVADASYPI